MLKLQLAHRLSRAADGMTLVLASTIAAHRAGSFDWHLVPTMLALSIPLWLFGSRTVRQYDEGNGRGFFGDIALTWMLFAAIAVPLALASEIVPSLRGMPVSPFATALLPIMTVVRAAIVGRLLWRLQSAQHVIIVGTGALGRLTGKEIQGARDERSVIGYLRFQDQEPNPRLQAPLLGSIDQIGEILERSVVDEVYFASTACHHAAEIQRALRTCEGLGAPFALPACSFRLGRAKPASESAVADGYVHYLSVQVKPLQLALKRLFDILSSATALVFLSPLLAVVALLVKLTSRGPIFFAQERVGMHGRTFRMLKFRSMVQNAEALKAELMPQNERSGPAFKIKRDPRVTTVGRWMRKFSIDELPQLVNVLRGDMSIVGPRPPLASEVNRYEAWQRRRLSVRPGLTCVWQVSGRDEIGFEDWMLLDMLYIDHWSLAQDFALILRTVPVVVLGRGAS